MSTTDHTCACGCGETVATRWAPGHNRRLNPNESYRVTKDGCWIWTRRRNNSGYGLVRRDYRVIFAHRLFYEQAKGPIPAGLVIDHLCRKPACVNPDHLEAVTPAENGRRSTTPTPARVPDAQLQALNDLQDVLRRVTETSGWGSARVLRYVEACLLYEAKR